MLPAGPVLAALRSIRIGSTAVWLLLAGLAAVTAAGQAVRGGVPSAGELKRLSLEQLMDIEVTSVSKHPEKLFEAAAAIQVVNGDDIRRAGATSLPEALRLAPNLETARIDARQWAITARGFNNLFADKMLVLIDGRTVYTPLYAGVYWDVQDTLLEDLDRIEVISGPGATQWGANAVNGVINIITRNARDTQGALVTGTAGTAFSGGALRYGGQAAPGTYYRVYAKSMGRDQSYRLNGTGAMDDWRLGQAGFRVDADSMTGNMWTLQGDIYDGSFGRTGPDDISVRGRNLLGRWSRSLGENSDCKLQVYYDYTHRRIPGSFTQTLNTYDIDFQHRFQPAGTRQEVIWGAAGRAVGDDIVNTPANAFLPPRVTRRSFSGFVQDEFSLPELRLRCTAGAKLEHNDYTGWEFEPSLRAVLTPDRREVWWAAISRAVRTPSRIDRDLYSPATPPYRVAGGPRVVSEELLAYELGYRRQLASRLTLALAAFYNDYENLRSLEPLNPPAPFPVERSSGLRGHSAGAELTAELQATDSWRLSLGYTELRVHSEPQPGNPGTSSDRNIARDPNHQLSLRSRFDVSPQWEMDFTGRYVGPIASQGVPGYAEIDARLGWNPVPAWSVALVGQNLLHRRHAEFNAPGGRREIPRSFHLQAAWRY
jgi:iron complex outermembrane receptor protein